MTKFNTYNDELRQQNANKAFSMKKRIIVNTLIGFLVLFLTIGLGGTFYLIKWLNKEFDQNLSSKSRVLVSLVNADESGVAFDFSEEFMPEFGQGTEPEYFQLWLNNNKTLDKSESLISLTEETDLPVSDFISTREKFKDITLPDGRDGRMVRVSFFPKIQDDLDNNESLIDSLPVITLAVAKERESLDKTIRDFVLIFTAIVILFTVIAALTIWQMVTKGLKPLKNLQRKMSVLAIDNLSERLDLPNPPKELEDTVDQFNRMLGRMQESFEREKSFTSEIALELSTPISEMRNLAEAAVIESPSSTQYQNILNTTLEMEQTVANLMALARCEKGNVILEPQVIKLANRIDNYWLKHADKATRRSISHINKIDEKFKIISSSAELDVMFNNLITNAISHSVRGTEITTFSRTHDDILCVCMTSHTRNISAEDLDKMFERLWQKRHSSKLQGNSGLGLMLVKSYADLLGLKIETDLSDHGLLTIELCGFYQDH